MQNEKSNISHVLMVLGTSIIAALLITVFFVVQYSPSGRYNLTAVLISPEVLNDLNYNDINPKISSSDRFVFDKVVLNQKPIPLSSYKKIYSLIQNDKSLGSIPLEVERLFNSSVPLVIYVRTESPSSWQKDSKVFQRVDFAQGYYRVQLHEDNAVTQFVYFEHEHILDEIHGQ